MKETKIALVQMESKFGCVEKNISKMEYYINTAAAQKVNIICFPELCVQGYSREYSSKFAEPVPGPSSMRLKDAAVKHGIYVLAGIAEDSQPGGPYITQIVACPGGEILKYRKTHLGNSEKPHFKAGEEMPVFDLKTAAVGVEICWDLHFPEITTILSLAGAEIVFAPHASPVIMGDRRGTWLKYMTARAYDNTVYIAACNLVGEDGTGHSYCGGALVIDPKGNLLAESFHGGEDMLVVNLDPGIINKIRHLEENSMKYSFYLASRRPELYGSLSAKKLQKS